MKNLATENYTIVLRNDEKTGWFEHNTLGEDSGGGLWFEGKNLRDYDGVYELPIEVQQALASDGYTHKDFNGSNQWDYEVKKISNQLLF